MNYYIRVISRNDIPQKYQLEQGENLVGRSRSADIRIKEPDVSGKHFIVRLNGDEISIENLSSKGIYLDDQMLFENAIVKVGQHIFAGDALECIIEDEALSQKNDELHFTHNFSQDDHTPSSRGNETATGAATGTGVETEKDKTDQSQNKSQTADSHGTGDSLRTDGSQHTDDSANTTGGKSRDTAANKTRVATPAEIEYIKEQKKNRVSRIRFLRVLLLCLVACIIAGLFFLREEKGKKDGNWPVKADGSWDTALVSFKGQGIRNGGFSLFYPRYNNTSVKETKNKLTVHTSLGQKELIPLTLSLEFFSGSKVLKSTMSECLRAWTIALNNSKERWIFEKGSSTQFFGSGNGLPTTLLSYVREKDRKTWYGTLRMFRHSDKAYILRAEVPFEARERVEKTLTQTSFLLISPVFIKSHWEGGVAPVNMDWKTLRNLRNRLRNTSPISLARMHRLINGILIDSTLRGEKNKLQIAREMLLNLRELQTHSFNAMKIRHINAVLEGNSAAAEKIKSETAAVFSLNNDKRFFDIRTNKW